MIDGTVCGEVTAEHWGCSSSYDEVNCMHGGLIDIGYIPSPMSNEYHATDVNYDGNAVCRTNYLRVLNVMVPWTEVGDGDLVKDKAATEVSWVT